MTSTKRKISVSLDADLVEALEDRAEPLSTQINDAIRADLEREQRRRALDELLADLEAALGPPNEERVAHYMDLLR